MPTLHKASNKIRLATHGLFLCGTSSCLQVSPSQLFLGVPINSHKCSHSAHSAAGQTFSFLYARLWGYVGCLVLPVSVGVGCWWTCGCEDVAPATLRRAEVTGALLCGWKCPQHCWCVGAQVMPRLHSVLWFLKSALASSPSGENSYLCFIVSQRFQSSADLGAQYFSDLWARQLSSISVKCSSPQDLAQVPGGREGGALGGRGSHRTRWATLAWY